MSVMRLLAGVLGMSIALLGCATDEMSQARSRGSCSRGATDEMLQARTRGSCFISGCSGEVCSDRPGVITGCEWHDAYACFCDATCERQPDGACGWTETPEVLACLASHD